MTYEHLEMEIAGLDLKIAALELNVLRVKTNFLALRDEWRQGGGGLLAPPPELLAAESEVQQLRAEFGKTQTELTALLAKAEKGEQVEIDISFLIDRCARLAGGRV